MSYPLNIRAKLAASVSEVQGRPPPACPPCVCAPARYFTYAMLVRAVLKGAPMWDPRHFHTGNEQEDEEVNDMVQQLIGTASS